MPVPRPTVTRGPEGKALETDMPGSFRSQMSVVAAKLRAHLGGLAAIRLALWKGIFL